MINALESIATDATPSKLIPQSRISPENGADSPISLTCDLARARAYARDYEKPHAPILFAFGAGPLHEHRLSGHWDLERAVAENSDALMRSICRSSTQSDKAVPPAWDDLTFRFGPAQFLYANRDTIGAFAATASEAEHLATWFRKKYAAPAAPEGGAFFLIQIERNDIECQKVPLSCETILDDETLNLHYGNGSQEWHRGLVEKLMKTPNGLTILEGNPGTGKTCYLRHLMGILKESHRFYFIPTSTMNVLSRPDFIGFWANQRSQYSDRKFVVILEDSDAALMTRGSDNHEEVSALLNLSDGMLADFLRLQIICTINCAAADIDQALLRPGRLLCHRVFRRLDYAQAARLAESLGRKLPVAEDYSLAEVFAGQNKHETKHAHLGFGA